MKTRILKTILASVLTFIVGTSHGISQEILQPQVMPTTSFVGEADSTLASETIVRAIALDGNMGTIMYTYHPSTGGMFVLNHTTYDCKKVNAPEKIRVADMKVVDHIVYWCGRSESTGKGVVGYFDASLFNTGTVQYSLAEFPDVQFVDCYSSQPFNYSTPTNIFKLEVLSPLGVFPHVAVLCEMNNGTDTVTALGEMGAISANNVIYGTAIFTPFNVERYYDMTLTDNYLLTISTKGPGEELPAYMVRYFSRTQSPFLSPTSLNPTPSFASYRNVSQSSGPSLIEALTGDDFIVAYHSNNDTAQPNTKLFLDLYKNVNFATGTLTATRSAMMSVPAITSTHNTMYDLVYDASNSTFRILHEVNASNMQRIIRVDTALSSCTIDDISDCRIQSIDYNYNLLTASGIHISTNRWMQYGKPASASMDCIDNTSAVIHQEPQEVISNVNWCFGADMQRPTLSSDTKPVIDESYHFSCKKER